MRKHQTLLMGIVKLTSMFLFFVVLTTTAICIGNPVQFTAAEDNYGYSFDFVWCNPETGYEVYIDDLADLLTSVQEEELLENMKEISMYGHVAFVSISQNPYNDSEDYIREYYFDTFGNDSGTVFLIDMDCRNIRIHSNGAIYKTITSAYADTITDNVYTYASGNDYFTCANTAFEQIATLLKGERIAQPMKYISNALLAVILALLINYFLVMLLSRSRKASANQLISGIYSKVDIANIRIDYVNQTRRYSPQSSGGGGSHGGGGGGGGSHGGGGGGHSF